MAIVIILVLCLVVLLLSLALYSFIKANIYLSKKDKEFITFVIDMYIQYGDELKISSKEQEEVIIKNLNEIKKKILKGKKI